MKNLKFNREELLTLDFQIALVYIISSDEMYNSIFDDNTMFHALLTLVETKFEQRGLDFEISEDELVEMIFENTDGQFQEYISSIENILDSLNQKGSVLAIMNILMYVIKYEAENILEMKEFSDSFDEEFSQL